ncbi:hypothetical protein HPULCUR_011116 [Helicostylum pulchrum]|uniref:Cation/H+ exchanger transmembrane domain-containing protein n=1 Tax=Helicostylum pulchrum TaxID=562976 RepID=A0ABP9YF92_9FUNG
MSDTVSIVAAIIGGFILLYGLTSLVIKEKLYLSEASVAILCGIIFGPLCANFIDVSEWGDEVTITKEFSRIVIGIQVMAAGVALPKKYLYKELKSILVLLGPVMVWMWLSSGLFVWVLIPGLNFTEALMIAACFTPTDPVLANSIVHGKFAEKHVPLHVRQIISCESGANDGLGYPFLFIAVYLLQMDSTGAAIGKWAYWIMGYNVILSCIIGFAAGYVARKLLQLSEQRRLIDKESILVFSVALALFLMGTIGLIKSDDLLACFVAGNSFTWDDWFRIETEKSHMIEPWSLFHDISIQIDLWRLLVLALLVLLFRRLPVVLTLYKFIPAVRTWREAVFTGWFGPIGVGAIFYYSIALESLPIDGPNAHAREVLKPIIYFMVLTSVITHGITIPLFYIGTFATRTLTRTSESGGIRVLRIPKIGRKNTPPISVDTDISEASAIQDNEDVEPTQRHTTITILTPDQRPNLTAPEKNLSELPTSFTAENHTNNTADNSTRYL